MTKKRIAISVDDDVYDGLKMVPRGVSVSQMVNFVLRAAFKEFMADLTMKPWTQEDFEEWVKKDPQLKKTRHELFLKPGAPLGKKPKGKK